MLLRSSGRRLASAVVVVSVLGVVFGAASLADSYSVPSGAWTLNATGHGRYDGLRKWRSRSYGYLPASIRLTPVCPQLTCATNASITLRNGRTVAFKLRYTALEYTHDTGMVTFRGRFCSRRAKINFFLGASMVADDNGQPKALAAMARALIYDAGCRPPAGSNAIVRMRGTLIPTPTGQAGR